MSHHWIALDRRLLGAALFVTASLAAISRPSPAQDRDAAADAPTQPSLPDRVFNVERAGVRFAIHAWARRPTGTEVAVHGMTRSDARILPEEHSPSCSNSN